MYWEIYWWHVIHEDRPISSVRGTGVVFVRDNDFIGILCFGSLFLMSILLFWTVRIKDHSRQQKFGVLAMTQLSCNL